MVDSLSNFPVALLVDGILSFLQNRFSRPDIVPPEYRWHQDDRQSRIRISGQYALDNQTPASLPSITVRRSGLTFASMGIDNLQKADANTFTNAQYEDWLDGTIDILCEAGAASEASSIANFLAIEFQANRHAIKDVLKFVRFLSYLDISPEMKVEGTVDNRRWQVALRLKVSVYIGWIKRSEDTIPFSKAEIRNISDTNTWASTKGSTVQGEPYISDSTANFGLLITSAPQLLEAELLKKWYYVLIGDSNRLYTVEEIVDNHRIRLSDRDAQDATVAFSATSTASELSYRIVWNTIHLDVKIPNRPSSQA